MKSKGGDNLISKRKKFTFIFLEAVNYDLVKDVGMMPKYLNLLYDYEGILMTYNNGEYLYLDKYCDGLKVNYIKKSRFLSNYAEKFDINCVKYLLLNSKKIHILQMRYLWVFGYLFYGIIYKLINKNGYLYIRADISDSFKKFNLNYIERFLFNRYRFDFINVHFKGVIRKLFFKLVDLISFESKELVRYHKEKYPELAHKFFYLPYGVDDHFINMGKIIRIPYEEKENIILYVGRVGAKYKSIETLLDAILKIDNLKNWRIIFIGPVESEFNTYLKNYFKNNPHIEEKIEFLGLITDRQRLFEFYSKSKIFCYPTLSESFGIVLVEAGYFGNYIVSTNYSASRDITNNGAYGDFFKSQDSKELAIILGKLIIDESILKENYSKIIAHIEQNFLWSKIIKDFYKRLSLIKK